jgi:hypothetical protein
MGWDFSTDNGSFPKDVLACFESSACANAVSPNKVISQSIVKIRDTCKSKWFSFLFLLLILCHYFEYSRLNKGLYSNGIIKLKINS